MSMNRISKTADKQQSNLVFVVELFLMFLLLLAVIVVITMVCMTTRQESIRAGELTDAVICAENAAEITRGAGSPAEAADLLGQMEGVSDACVSGDTVTARQKDGYYIRVTISSEEDPAGTYTGEQISIFTGSEEPSPIYELHTGSFRKEVPHEP